MLKLKFTDIDEFLDWVDTENPPGERYYTTRKGESEGYTRIIAVVQSSRRRAYVIDNVKDEETDDIYDRLAELDFIFVEEIEGLR